MMQHRLPAYLIIIFMMFGCKKTNSQLSNTSNPIVLGGDLSYVNEVEDAGAKYQRNNSSVDPYGLFAEKGCNLVRLRLWHTPSINRYSGLEDVKKSIRRAKSANMRVLLDFHYSDIWADPGRQDIPKAWSTITDQNILGDSLYGYTLNTLLSLNKEGLLPEMVQVGNEINSEILQPQGKAKPGIDWKRNAFLLNKGIAAVREASSKSGKKIEVMLHIAQPENAIKWFADANANSIEPYDWIGISYYPLWSTVKIKDLPYFINNLVTTHKKQLLVVETAYPHTLANADPANNILDDKALVPGYPATPAGQKQYMIDLVKLVIQGGGAGLVYWEPAWISSSARTPWGQGSHWDNATFFDAANKNEALPVFDFFNQSNYPKK
jgi:arabinogalactan endo-1,4-beta-galactosidase